MLDYLEGYFESKNKNVNIEYRSSRGVKGKTEYKTGDDPNNQKFTDDQWVQVWVTLEK